MNGESPEIPESTTEQSAPAVEPLSVTDKFIGILSEPVVTYDNVRAAGFRTSDWLVPLLFLAVIAAVVTFLRFSDPEFVAQIKEQQTAQIQKSVEEGKMTQQQADQYQEGMEKFSGVQKGIAPVGALISIVIIFFLACLVYWLASRYGIKAAITFAGMMSVLGLAMYIDIIDSIVSIILGYVTKNFMATLSPALLMKPDLGDPMYKLANALNPIVIWKYSVFAIGLHIVSSVPKVKAFIVVFGLWILWTLLYVFVKIPGVG